MAQRRKREWRELEKLVARIEAILAPHGAVIKSPERLPDIHTGRLRQVDATIRFQIGSVPILIFVEARARAKSDDQTWIEQLATKRENLGASRVIAVSSSQLTEPAVELAKRKGIETRVMKAIGDSVITDWIDNFKLQVTQRQWAIKSISLDLFIPGMPEDQFQRLLAETKGRCSPFDVDFIWATNRRCKATDLVQAAADTGALRAPLLPIPQGSPSVIVDVEINFPLGLLQMKDQDTLYDVGKSKFKLEVREVLVGESGLGKASEYRSDTGAICQTIERTVSLPEGEFTATLFRDMSTGSISVRSTTIHAKTGTVKVIAHDELPQLSSKFPGVDAAGAR